MKPSKYLRYISKDFFQACGFLMIINAIFLRIYSTNTIKTSLLWQIILGALAYTFFKCALVNEHELGKKAQMINFTICSLLADIMVILWLWFFSPSKAVDINLIIFYIIVIVIVKIGVYALMYNNGKQQAKQLNEKLSNYKNE